MLERPQKRQRDLIERLRNVLRKHIAEVEEATLTPTWLAHQASADGVLIDRDFEEGVRIAGILIGQIQKTGGLAAFRQRLAPGPAAG